MSESNEPFFTADEWKATALLRPRAWRNWWSTEPLVTKVLVALLALLLCFGVYTLLSGNSELGWTLIVLVGGLLSLVVFLAITNVLAASIRWALRKSGLLATWYRVRKQVVAVARFVFWTGVVALVLAALWPYLSLHPAKSWYALTNKVPVDRVELAKMPHDCEFQTAPLGSKHCHYDAKVEVFESSEGPHPQKSLLVTYERVED